MSQDSNGTRTVMAVAVAIFVTLVAAILFLLIADDLADILAISIVLLALVAGLKLGGRLVESTYPSYNVAEVAVDGPISRDGGGDGVPRSPTTPGADDVVEQIERADEDDAVEALLVKLNTPGGEVVPSDDIRKAAVEFDGPTIAYTNDMCASGGMWIASGCDELWARDGSIVGSIGVMFAQVRFSQFLDDHGIDYEGITSGEYKDALSPFKSMADDERAYIQALSDAWYENFVERVAEGTEMDEQAIRDTEARVYLGEEAVEMDMVDALGDRDAIEEDLEERLGEPVTVEEFEPTRSIGARLRGGAQGVAYAFGAGVASRFGSRTGSLRME